jgi:hypothetical protein
MTARAPVQAEAPIMPRGCRQFIRLEPDYLHLATITNVTARNRRRQGYTAMPFNSATRSFPTCKR